MYHVCHVLCVICSGKKTSLPFLLFFVTDSHHQTKPQHNITSHRLDVSRYCLYLEHSRHNPSYFWIPAGNLSSTKSNLDDDDDNDYLQQHAHIDKVARCCLSSPSCSWPTPPSTSSPETKCRHRQHIHTPTYAIHHQRRETRRD